jgi:hypothetical protein
MANNGNGRLSTDSLTSELRNLNERFNAVPGTDGANSVPARILFFLAGIDSLKNTSYYETPEWCTNDTLMARA